MLQCWSAADALLRPKWTEHQSSMYNAWSES